MKTDITAEQITEAGFDLEDNGLHVLALCSFLDCQPDDLTTLPHDHYGLSVYGFGSSEYAIGADEDANQAAIDYIRDTVWAFNAGFILTECDLPSELEDAIRAFQEEKCESANDALLALVEKCCKSTSGSEGIEAFADSAIAADGRGHFLSSYDGNENEETVSTSEAEQPEWFYQASNGNESVTLYIYRIN